MTNQTSKEHDSDVAILEEIKQKFEKPKKYNVIFHNDDYTPMDFVIMVLVQIFNKDESEAVRLTLEIHEKGQAIVAQYSKEIAKTKKMQVDTVADKFEHPLKCTVEPAPEMNSSPRP